MFSVIFFKKTSFQLLNNWSSLTRFLIEMKFLYHEMIFFICENKRTKENRKTSHIIKCVMIFVFFMLKKLRYINYLVNNHNNYPSSKAFHVFEGDNALVNRFILLCFFLIKNFLLNDFFNRKRFNILKRRLTCFKVTRFFDFNEIEIERNEFDVLK